MKGKWCSDRSAEETGEMAGGCSRVSLHLTSCGFRIQFSMWQIIAFWNFLEFFVLKYFWSVVTWICGCRTYGYGELTMLFHLRMPHNSCKLSFFPFFLILWVIRDLSSSLQVLFSSWCSLLLTLYTTGFFCCFYLFIIF